MSLNLLGGKFYGTSATGTPLSGGKVYSYEAGTTTPSPTYTTQSLSVANENPVILDASGHASIWLGETAYRIVLKDSNNVTMYDVDNISTPVSLSEIYQVIAPPSLVEAGYLEYLWTYRLPVADEIYSSPIGPVTVTSGTTARIAVVFSAGDGYVYAVNSSTGALIWRYDTGAECYGRCQAADVNDDGKVEIFAASHSGKIVCLDDDGGMLWEFDSLYAREGAGTTTSATADTITDTGQAWHTNAFLRDSGATYGATLNMTSGPASGQSKEIIGTTATTLTLTSAFDPVPTVGGGDTYTITPRYASDVYFQHAGSLIQESGTWYLYACGLDNHVYKLNASTGALVWKYATLENIEPYPLLAVFAGTMHIVVPSIDGNVRSFSTAGSVQWTAAIGDVDAFLHATSTQVVVSCRGGRVRLLNGVTGAVESTSTDTSSWSFGDLDCAAVPVLLPGEASMRVLTGGDSGTVWCFDDDLNTLWQLPVVPNVINSSPIIHNVSGINDLAVLIGDMRGTLHCIDIESGRLIGVLYLKGGIEGTPYYGDIDGDGHVELIITTLDGYVQAYRFTNGVATGTTYVPGSAAHSGHY